jgi:CRISPR-associated protein Cmr1
MGLIGNIGSRSRRGYGSISFDYIKNNGEELFSNPKDLSDFQETIVNTISKRLFNGFPEYTAFSTKTRMIVAKTGNNPLKVLDEIGKEMMKYRSWGHNGQVLGQPSEKNFKHDHDWSKNPKSYDDNFHPRRIAFGLPQNYSKYVMVEPKNDDSKKSSRRASPLFIHIARTEDGKYHGVITIFESMFLPENFKINAGNIIVDQNIDFKVLHDFLNRFSNVTQIMGGE